MFVKRQTKVDIDTVKEIKAARFLCQNNYNERTETKTHLQYTITILPGFLIPYSRIPVDKIFNAFSGYLNGELETYYAAAIACGCNSRHSFRLYYFRILYRINAWYQLLVMNVVQKESVSSQPCNEIDEKWGLIVVELKSRASETEIPQWQAHGHTYFYFNKMGLGP